MKVLIGILSSFFISQSVLAEQAEVLHTLQGQDRSSGQACFLYVLDMSLDNVGRIQSLNVQSSYSHEDEESPEFTLTKMNNRPDTYMGQDGKDQFALVLAPGGTTLDQALSFSIRWLHGHHYHTDTCNQLKPTP